MGPGSIASIARTVLLALALSVAHAPAQAQPFPSPREVAQPDERALADEVTEMMLSVPPSDANRLGRLDTLLARLQRPTPLRGLVQYFRATLAMEAERPDIAAEAIEESIRLLPGYSAPLILAFEVEVYADRPQQAADYLMRASEIDPETVRRIPDYELQNLVLRLGSGEHRRHLLRVAERLFAIGWLGESLALRSTLGLQVIEARMEADDVAGAEALLPRLLAPRDVRRLLMQNRYRAIWRRTEQWAGARQENLWPSFLAEQRTKWRASRDPAQARLYATALEDAQHLQTIVDEMLPLFSDNMDREDDYDLVWIASPLGDALARLGRWDEIDALYDRALRTWPPGSQVNALNLVANRARHQLMRGRAAAALAGLDVSIAESNRSGGAVSLSALATIHLYRACALHELGRRADILPSIAHVARVGAPLMMARLYLCLDRPEAARDVLIAALEQQETRASIIEFAQRDPTPPMQSDYGRRSHARMAALREDPVLVAAITRYGRILPHPLSAGAPPESGER